MILSDATLSLNEKKRRINVNNISYRKKKVKLRSKINLSFFFWLKLNFKNHVECGQQQGDKRKRLDFGLLIVTYGI